MAIVIPIKGERLKDFLEEMLSGIPHDCLTIIVSNSPREPIDRYKLEKQAFEQFNRFAEKKSVIIHQKDPGLAKALEKLGIRIFLTQRVKYVMVKERACSLACFFQK